MHRLTEYSPHKQGYLDRLHMHHEQEVVLLVDTALIGMGKHTCMKGNRRNAQRLTMCILSAQAAEDRRQGPMSQSSQAQGQAQSPRAPAQTVGPLPL